jgi:hypothetical protein
MRSTTDTVVIHTRDEHGLEQIRHDHVQAVVYEPPDPPAWLAELSEVVRDGRFIVPRTILGDAGRDEIAAWLDRHLPIDALARPAGRALREDVLGLVDRLAASTGASRFQLRVLTDAPSRHCGFHVDTVPPGAPRWGLLRVYNGAGTHYASPGDLTSITDFYRYLSRRERLIRELGEAPDAAARAMLEDQLAGLDGRLEFLHRGARIATAPAGSIVAFKHLDVRLHWSGHDPALAWIHCSPMEGEPRFLVNVTAVRPADRRSRGASAR